MARVIFLMCVLVGLSACCPVAPVRREPPAAITLGEQARRLGEWSRGLVRVKATIATAGAHLELPDGRGGMQSFNAEGTLLLQQHPEAAAGSAEARGEVYLRGSMFAAKVFEGGRNANDWWFSIYGDYKTARTGDASRPVNLGSLSGADSSGILRADLVLEMLGLSPLPTEARGGQGFTLMRVNDAERTNEIFVTSPAGGAMPVFMREIIVDRFSGHVSEVRLFNPDGVLVVRSELSEYAAVSYPDDAAKPSGAAIPQFPRKVMLFYPAQKTTILLKFEEVLVPATLPPAAFLTPDFGKENLKVIRVE